MKLAGFEALNTYSAARATLGTAAAKPVEAHPTEGSAFESVKALAEAISKGEKASQSYLAGDADPHSVIEALAAAELAIDTAVVVRDKVVEAYQELLRMPV